jgi:hypothetical protein
LALILFGSGTSKVLLAGGAGLIAHGIVDRHTDDLDGFIHSRENFIEVARGREISMTCRSP